MPTADLQNPNPKPGDLLRDEAANLLSAKYGGHKVEKRAFGKKVDVVFEFLDFERPKRLFVEAKDYKSPLTRAQVRDIWADYMGLIETRRPADLLIVTRSGLTPDARAYIEDELDRVRHQTIWELENNILGLTEYLRYLTGVFREDGLHEYYVEARAKAVQYDETKQVRWLSDQETPIFEEIIRWLKSDSAIPMAVLGGYGAGKTSLARRLASHQAALALADPAARRPLFVKLGAFSRFSSIEGIFGAMFSSEFPVSSFNFHHFMAANERGRLLIVLDGFDEMKHAMTWTDFRSQAMELNRLISPQSRVLLLGRPTAFLSQEEHIHVLQGLRRVGQLWHRIPDWPEFREFELQDFSSDERSEFVGKYLSRKELISFSGSQLTAEEIQNRARRVNELADLAPDVFAKPVHAKILTDLGADPSFDLERFGSGVSRWQLYEAFFETLADRETVKEARRGIAAKARLEFLRELALWLWTKQGGSTAFSAGDIPPSLIASLPGDDFTDSETKAREYLTGSALEKKSGDIFYFGHRSFAEFLVAQRMVIKPPTQEEHAIYSDIMQGGVGIFLLEGVDSSIFRSWTQSLSGARGNIRLEYLATLAKGVGNVRKLRNELKRESVWRSILEHFEGTFTYGPLLESQIIRSIRNADNVYASLLIKLLNASMASRELDLKSIDAEILTSLATVLMEREFGRIRDDFGFLADRPALADPKLLFRSAVARQPNDTRIVIRGDKLLRQCETILREVGINLITLHDGEEVQGIPRSLSLDWSKVHAKVGIFHRSRSKQVYYSLTVSKVHGEVP